jgi:hypothetical protein
MIASFQTTRRERYAPGCIPIDTDANVKVSEAESMQAFRNVCATTTRAFAAGVASP